MSASAGFVPPPYPYDRLTPLRELAAGRHGSVIDLSVGTPCDPPPPSVLAALDESTSARSYPPSVGSAAFRAAVSRWFERRLEVAVDPEHVAACVGSKELVAGVPHWLRLRTPDRDTVLYPAISYPSYAMGARLAGCRAVPVPVDDRWRLRVDAIDPLDAERALCLWSNTPGNPAGGLDDLAQVAEWGRAHGVPVFSDECYVEFTWSGTPRGDGAEPGETILAHGDRGVVAVHSLSKRSNLAGLRVGHYSGDPDLVQYLSEVRKHAGLMVPGPAQLAACVALDDQDHVRSQRDAYRRRLEQLAGVFGDLGLDAPFPGGGFYLWVEAPDRDAWALARQLAERLGILVSPGEFYGEAGDGHVRVAAVQPDEVVREIIRRAS